MIRTNAKVLSILFLLVLPSSCKQRTVSELSDAVDPGNSSFGTGRDVATMTPKRNCFKRDSFLEGRIAAMESTEGDSQSQVSTDGGRLNLTQINQMNIQTNVISTASSASSSQEIGVDAGLKIPDGLLKNLNFSPEFSLKVKNVLNENRKSNVDSYILTVKYLSHAVSIQPDDQDLKPEVLGLLDGKEDNFKKFIGACGDEFLSIKEYGGEINLVFGASASTTASSSNSSIAGGVKVDAPIGIGANIDGRLNRKTNLGGIEKISNFAISENILNRSTIADCHVSRMNNDGMQEQVTHDRPFLPRSKNELDEFIFCLPRWIKPVPVSFHYTDYSTVFPVALDQSLIDQYQTGYITAKKSRAEKSLAQEQARLAQIEKEQKIQEAVAQVKLPEKKSLEIPQLKIGKYPNGYRPDGKDRQTRLNMIKKYIRENQVFATASECVIAGCAGYNEVSGACTLCQEPTQGLGLAGINFCRDDTDCSSGLSCQAGRDRKTGICR